MAIGLSVASASRGPKSLRFLCSVQHQVPETRETLIKLSRQSRRFHAEGTCGDEVADNHLRVRDRASLRQCDSEKQTTPHLPNREQVGKLVRHERPRFCRAVLSAIALATAEVLQIGRADYLIGGENRGLYLCGYRDHLHHRRGQLRSGRTGLAEVPAVGLRLR